MVDRRGGRGDRISAGTEKVNFVRVARFNGAARKGLAVALGKFGDAIVDGVNAGRMELFVIDGRSWLVTEIRDDVLVVWCYEGRDALKLGHVALRLAKRNGLAAVEFWTYRKGFIRLGKPLGFERVETDADGCFLMQATTQ